MHFGRPPLLDNRPRGFISEPRAGRALALSWVRRRSQAPCTPNATVRARARSSAVLRTTQHPPVGRGPHAMRSASPSAPTAFAPARVQARRYTLPARENNSQT